MRRVDAEADPASLDFAALRTLQLVHQLGSFTAAAEHLDVNQSAISYTIAKLRAAFGDPLFVREAGRQVPTDRCRDLLARSAQILDLLDVMAQPDRFLPEASTETVAIACNYYERILLIPSILSALRAEAPELRVRVINAFGEGHQLLLNRQADVLIGPFARSEAGFHSRYLYTEDYACLMDPAHPLAGRDLGVEDYLGLRHVQIDYGGGWKSAYLRDLEAANHRIEPTLFLPSPAGLAELIAGSNLVATLPRRLGARIGRGLALSNPPIRSAFRVSLVWTARTNPSPKHRWLRDVILRAREAW